MKVASAVQSRDEIGLRPQLRYPEADEFRIETELVIAVGCCHEIRRSSGVGIAKRRKTLVKASDSIVEAPQDMAVNIDHGDAGSPAPAPKNLVKKYTTINRNRIKADHGAIRFRSFDKPCHRRALEAASAALPPLKNIPSHDPMRSADT
jgi:hypothetical protein